MTAEVRMFETFFNTTDTPVTVDDEGRTIPGGCWGSADPAQPTAAAAVEAGQIVKVDEPDKGADVDPAAAEAFAATRELNKRKPERAAPAAEVTTDQPTEEQS